MARASKRILRFLQRRGVITLVTAPGDGEAAVVADETMGEKDPLLAKLLAAATAGMPPAGPANKRKAIRIVLNPDARPVAKGNLCAQGHAFNLHTRLRRCRRPGAPLHYPNPAYPQIPLGSPQMNGAMPG